MENVSGDAALVESMDERVCGEYAMFIEYLAGETSLTDEESHLLTGVQHALVSSIRRANAASDGGSSRRSVRT